MKENPWARLLAYVTGLIIQELLLKNEYLAAESNGGLSGEHIITDSSTPHHNPRVGRE